MKVLLLSCVLFLFAVLYTEAERNEDEIIAECKKDLGIPEDNTNERKLRCLEICRLQKLGIIESGRKVNIDVLKERVSESIGNDHQVDEFMKKVQNCRAAAMTIEDDCDFYNAVKKCTQDS